MSVRKELFDKKTWVSAQRKVISTHCLHARFYPHCTGNTFPTNIKLKFCDVTLLKHNPRFFAIIRRMKNCQIIEFPPAEKRVEGALNPLDPPSLQTPPRVHIAIAWNIFLVPQETQNKLIWGEKKMRKPGRGLLVILHHVRLGGWKASQLLDRTFKKESKEV